MTYTIRKATEEDLVYLAPRLRAADKLEFQAATGSKDHLRSLTLSAQASDEVFVGCDSQGPQMIWGAGFNADRTEAMIWAVATPVVEGYAKALVKDGRQIISRWFQENPKLRFLWNFTHGKNKLHHVWLKAMGAKMLPEVKNALTGEPFLPFSIERKTTTCVSELERASAWPSASPQA